MFLVFKFPLVNFKTGSTKLITLIVIQFITTVNDGATLKSKISLNQK